MAGEEQLHGRVGPDPDVQVPAMFDRRQRSVRRHRVNRRWSQERDISGQSGEGLGERIANRGQPAKVARATVDRRPGGYLVEHRLAGGVLDSRAFVTCQTPHEERLSR